MVVISGRVGDEINAIQVNDVKADVTEALIEYAHLKSISNLDLVARNLFVVADKYKIIDVKVIFIF
jgi:hypothetical protein